jgi:hypothetical protein
MGIFDFFNKKPSGESKPSWYSKVPKQIADTLWNEIISNPEKYILKSNVYANLYFKYFIIIKIVWIFLNAIKNKWVSPENYKISVFNNTNNEIAKYFLLFNLFYPILDRLKI